MNVAVMVFGPGAENGIRTRDPQLGKLMLYRLSYFRKYVDHSLHNGANIRFFPEKCKDAAFYL